MSQTATAAARDPMVDSADGVASRRRLAVWLFGVALLVFAMVMLGGATRLTDSGLSIVEWKPVTGVLPPLGEAAWQAEFDKYRAFPEYQKINRGMTLAEFKRIYWYEYAHRLLGRAIGLAFLAPFLWFLARGQVPRRLVPVLAGLFVLGGLQGAVGWWMVASGLVDRPDVSHYRLTVHLGLAVVLYAALLWVALGLWRGRSAAAADRLAPAAGAVCGLVFVQILLGGLVAGLDAGLIYYTFPLLNGEFLPAGAFSASPWWLNPLENVALVQFDHRIGAYLLLLAVAALWWRLRAGRHAGPALLLVAATLLQAAIGVATVLLVVPVWLGVTHQAGALAVLTVAVTLWHRLARPAATGAAAHATRTAP